MPENILIAIAWPYANAEIHVGNLTGSHLPGDIIARFHRLKGNHVLVVSGTDSHGTPVTMRADAEGKPVEEVYKRFHDSFIEVFKGYGITYDLFTTTHTENHFKVSQAIFLALKENGFMFTQKSMQWYSPSKGKFLPDRYVEGTCYICGYEGARSDQCDKCGNVLEPEKLLNPRAKSGDDALELRETEHFYIDLSKLEPDVKQFLKARASYMREPVLGESLGKIEAEGLKPRPITRDLDWGIPVPVEGWEGKCLYVWFEAVIGYLSAAIEWSKINGDDEWRKWWVNPSARQFYFIGKDNIFFHTSLWPAQLMGAGAQFLQIFAADENPQPLTLPYDVPANQFMNLENDKISGSRNWAVWAQDAVSRYDPDAVRYYLTANMPEMKDSDWDWDDFIERNNAELVATWGNLANRVLSFSFKHWEGHAPAIDPANLRDADRELLATIEQGFTTVAGLYDSVKLRETLRECLRLSTEVNRYLDANAPWTAIKTDRDSAALTIFTALKAIDSLKVLFAPVLPFTSQKLHEFFSYETPLFGEQYTQTVGDSLGEHTVLRYRAPLQDSWKMSDLQPGAKLNQPAPLFKKLEMILAVEERRRLRGEI
jgi:methionyl-tRNA synthetase